MNLYLYFAILLVLVLAVLCAPLMHNGQISAGVRKKFIGLLVVMFFGGAFGIYRLIGAPEIVPLLEMRDAKLAQLKDAMQSEAAAIKANPKDVRSMVELGQNFLQTGQFDAAANIFKQAVIVTGGDPKLIMAYARSLILADDGQVSDQAKKSLDMVILQDPNNPDARYFLAVRKLQDGHQQEAMQEMKALYHSLPQDSPLKAMIDRQIGRTP